VENVYLTIVLAPLLGAIAAGFFGARLGRRGAHSVTIAGVAVFGWPVAHGCWRASSGVRRPSTTARSTPGWSRTGCASRSASWSIKLTAVMMATVTFVSLMVHIYTIGYMADDEHNWPKGRCAGKNSYQRFFSYISLFTFSMLMLVMSNNFMQLVFGWEAVGLVSYLLIGFWSTRESAVFANLKAFLVNRVGDFGFILGIAAIGMYFGSMDYAEVFAAAPAHADTQVALCSAACRS
jgi:NADH-quinone oxidoreductase subunit L